VIPVELEQRMCVLDKAASVEIDAKSQEGWDATGFGEMGHSWLIAERWECESAGDSSSENSAFKHPSSPASTQF
jgi:hypothetical protein